MMKTRIILQLALVLPACIIVTSSSSTSFRPRRATANHLGHNDNRHTKSTISNNGSSSLLVDANTNSKREKSSRLDQLQATTAARGGGDVVAINTFNPDIPKVSELVGAFFFTILQILVTKLFRTNNIVFPAMLGCTILVFTSLVLANLLPTNGSNNLGDVAYQLLLPGSTLLAKWLPVMFVPGLAMLPLAPSIGSVIDGIKILSVIVLGFGFTMISTSYLVLGIRTLQGRVGSGGSSVTTTTASYNIPDEKKKKFGLLTKSSAIVGTPSPLPRPPTKPFTQETLHFFFKGTIIFGMISMIASRSQQSNSVYTTPLRTIFMFFGTVLSYVYGARLPSSITKIIHPLVTATVGTLVLTQLDASVTGLPFTTVLKTYKAGSLALSKVGAGDVLLFLLGPAVGCLSIAMYSRKSILVTNLPVVVAAMLCSSLGGLFGTAWYIRLLDVGTSTMVRLSLLTRNVTTGLAIIITQMLDGDMAIAASVVVLTGIFAATVGRGLLDALQISDPVSRGLGMGAAGQGLGVAAMMVEVDAFPFAAINMVLTAICASALVSIPSVKQSLVNIVSTELK
jgi:putative effector of murein hydrolase